MQYNTSIRNNNLKKKQDKYAVGHFWFIPMKCSSRLLLKGSASQHVQEASSTTDKEDSFCFLMNVISSQNFKLN